MSWKATTLPPPPGLHEPLDQAPVQAAHQLGVGPGQLLERAAGEADGHAVVVGHDGGVEPEGGQLGEERLLARHGAVGAGGGGGALLAAGVDGVGGREAGAGREAQEHAGQHRERRRLEAEGGGVGGEGVPVLRAAHRTSGVGDDVEQPTSRIRSRWGRTVFGCRSSWSAISAVASGIGARASSR